MKKILLTVFTALLTLNGFSQDCNIGNQVETSNFTTGSSFGSERITGNKFKLSQLGTLKSFGYVGNLSGSEIRMALYSDKNGLADSLITFTSNTAIVKGIASISVTPIELPAGDYWICAVYKVSGNHMKMYNESVKTTKYCGAEVLFNDPFPSNSSSFSYYTGLQFLYFLNIDCGNTLSVENGLNANQGVEIYPNPSSSFVKISGVSNNTGYFIVDATGKTVATGVLTENTEINIESLTSGLYFINFNNGTQSIKFVK